MIILIVNEEKSERTYKTELITSHGIDEATGENIVLQQIHPSLLGAIFNRNIGEWVIE